MGNVDTQTQTHTQDNYRNPRACAPRVNEDITNTRILWYHLHSEEKERKGEGKYKGTVSCSCA